MINIDDINFRYLVEDDLLDLLDKCQPPPNQHVLEIGAGGDNFQLLVISPDEDLSLINEGPSIEEESYQLQDAGPVNNITRDVSTQPPNSNGKPKVNKRDDNTIDRKVLTAFRAPSVVECLRCHFSGSQKAAKSVPRSLLGIGQLLQIFELTSQAFNVDRDALVRNLQQQLQKVQAEYDKKPDRRACFQEHFGNALEAFKTATTPEQRMKILYKGRAHSRQLRELLKFREQFRVEIQKYLANIKK